MKKLGGFVVVIVLVIGVIICMKSLVKVPAGYVAVQYNANGGVKKEVLNQGWHWKSPMVKTTLYTVGLEQSYLTASKKGDSPDDDSFTASSSEGKSMTLELTYTYYKVSDILGSERANINNAVSDYLAKKFEPYGITISNVSLINIDVDKDTMKAINAKIKAQQDAETQAIQNQTNIDKAKADAEAEVTKAQGDADAKVIAAQAEADANAKINSSITDQLIRMKEAEARLKHGWVTVQGSDTVVTKNADSDQ